MPVPFILGAAKAIPAPLIIPQLQSKFKLIYSLLLYHYHHRHYSVIQLHSTPQFTAPIPSIQFISILPCWIPRCSCASPTGTRHSAVGLRVRTGDHKLARWPVRHLERPSPTSTAPTRFPAHGCELRGPGYCSGVMTAGQDGTVVVIILRSRFTHSPARIS